MVNRLAVIGNLTAAGEAEWDGMGRSKRRGEETETAR